MKARHSPRLATFFPCALAAVCLVLFAPGTQAQTSGSLTPTTQYYNYSTAPWVITSGTGPYPDGGGVATFNPYAPASTPTIARPTPIITLDVSPTLSQIVFNFPGTLFIDPPQGNSNVSIIAANTGLTINTTNPRGDFEIQTVVSGGGTAGLTVTGAGSLALSGLNTYTGGTHINGGTLYVGGLGNSDDSLGAKGAGNGISINGGTLVFAGSSGTNSARDISIGTGGATLSSTGASTLSGVISGSGPLTMSGLVLQGVNTYTGATTTKGGLTLSGAGSLLTTPSYDLSGNLQLDNGGTNVTNRLSDTAPITLHGITFSSLNNANAPSSETVGAVTAVNGFNTFTVNAAAANYNAPVLSSNSLTMASLSRQNNATFVFSGTNLGATPGVGVANIYSTAAPALVGGGGAAGSTNISILPYAVGDTSGQSGLSQNYYNESFVTYGANGFRPLATTEYATAFGGNNSDNVRLTAATTVPTAGATVNALLLAPSAASTADAPLLYGGTVNVTSGAVLYSPTTTNSTTGYVSAGLNFGSAEGVITNTDRLFIPGVISGSGGLTLTSEFRTNAVFISTMTLAGANTYTGNTTINAGGIAFSGTTGGGTAGAFGPSGTIILNSGAQQYAGLAPNNAAVINNPVSVTGLGQNYIVPTSNNYTVTFNAPISLSTNLNVFGADARPASALIFNGTISGPGSLTDINLTTAATTYAVLNGNNTYSGGTIIQGGIYNAGTDTAFGTGTITFNPSGSFGPNSPAGTIAGVGSAARTFANPIVINGAPVTLTGSAPLTFTGPVTVNGGATLNVTNSSLTTFSGAVSGDGISKLGAGALAFNSPTGNTFTGGFSSSGQAYATGVAVYGQTASAIYANNTSGSAFGTGAVSIGADSKTVFSTLAGTFSTSGATSIAGRLSPGNGTGLTSTTAGIGSIGTETFTTTLTLSSATTSSLYMEVGAGNTSDQIKVGGVFTLAGTVYIASLNGYAIQNGDTFTLVTAGTLTPGTVTFDTTNATLASGVSLVETFTGTQLIVNAVPEPGTYAFLAMGGALAAAGLVRRRSMCV